MIADSVEFLRGHGRLVLVDMEHFFDGYKANPEFSLRALEAAVVKGASHVVLCDTNGGSLPHEIEAIVGAVHAHVGADVTIGIHCHDDTGCAVANSMAAVRAGARHVQGTLNGLGERTGNANLTTIIPNLQLKLGYRVPARRAASSASPRSATTSPSCSTGPSTRRRRTSGRRRSPTRPGCTPAPSPAPRTPTSTSTPSSSATAPASWSARWPGGRRSR